MKLKMENMVYSCLLAYCFSAISGDSAFWDIARQNIVTMEFDRLLNENVCQRK